MKLSLLLLLLCPIIVTGQTIVKGKVQDKKGNPIEFANVFIKDSYDGTTSASDGSFEFETFEEGEQILAANFVGFLPYKDTVQLDGDTVEVTITLLENDENLDPVVISAGSFEASDEKKSVVLRPLDIVTTAGAGGDLFQAIQTLPGAQQVGESEGLFVRGGAASETKTIIDEMIVQNPFFSSVPNVPQRGRFSPFLFKGTIFSTGGYSAVYGQALSSALILNSVDMFQQNSTSFGIMPIGGNISHTVSKEKTAVSISAGYTNLAPYFKIIKQQRDWIQEPEGANGTFIVRQKVGEKGIFKFYGTYSQNQLALMYENLETPGIKDRFSLFNRNVYTNTSYKQYIGENWSLFTGLSYTWDEDEIDQTFFNLTSTDQLSQAKIIATRDFGKRSQFKFGGEVHDQVIEAVYDTFPGRLHELYTAAFAEGDIFLSTRLAVRLGTRFETSQILNEENIAPRASVSYKTGEYSQMSVAYGKFYQTPENRYLFTTTGLNFENATHYIANYQWMDDNRTFRIEGYNKDYNSLVSYQLDSTTGLFNELDNSGFGYAYGFDVFYRDRKTIKNADFWISYSFLETQRKYQNYPIAAPPTFTSKHTLSLVYKHWVDKLKTSFGFTYAYGSGRPYYNPNLNRGEFHSQTAPEYINLSINASHLTNILGGFTVIFASVDNVLNRNNVFTYQFSSDGQTQRRVGPPQLRSFFVGMFISFDRDEIKKKKAEKSNIE